MMLIMLVMMMVVGVPQGDTLKENFKVVTRVAFVWCVFGSIYKLLRCGYVFLKGFCADIIQFSWNFNCIVCLFVCCVNCMSCEICLELR